MNAFVTIFYDWSRVVAGYFTWAAPLAVRIVVGWVFLWSGWGKLQILPRMVENFRSWNIPAPEILAPFVSGMEFVGGLLLLVGLLTRFVAVPMMRDHGGGHHLGQVGRCRFARDFARLRGSLLFRDVRLATALPAPGRSRSTILS